MDTNLNPRPDRRTAIKWMLTAVSATALLPRNTPGTEPMETHPTSAGGPGYGTDPNLLRDYKPGDLWPLTFTEAQRRTAAALCAIIIPADDRSPSAADLGVHDFIDEWISAPYPDQADDRAPILDGLAWIDGEARSRFGRDFAELEEKQQAAICDDICRPREAKPGFEEAARFFSRYRNLTAGGFYTTPEGMLDIGYVGNRPSLTFDGPPPDLVKSLGLN